MRPAAGTDLVIIACEQCDTRFQLDASRIPAKGARVRCSRCKHAFYVRRPGASVEEALEEVVAEATAPGASTAPPPSEDPEPDGEGASGEAGDAFEADWEFNDEPPGAAPPTAAPPARGRAASAKAPPAREEPTADEDLEALGDPEEWNLLADAPLPAASRALEDDDADPLAGLLDGEEPREESATTAGPSEAASAASGEPEERRVSRLPGLGPVGAAAGWTATLVLSALAVSALLTRTLDPPRALEPAPRTVELAHGTAFDVRGGYVDNALAGELFVVSGRFEPTGTTWGPAAQGVEVQLLGAGGRELSGAASWAGPELSELQLRELAPESLREALGQSAAFLGSSKKGRFQAVFAEVPPDAVDFSLRARPLPSTSPPPSPPPSSE